MLVPAILYKDQIEKASKRMMYDDSAFFDSGSVHPSYITIQRDQNDKKVTYFEYAIVDDKEELIGWMRYYISWYSNQLYIAGITNLTGKPNPIIGFDLYKEILRVINTYNIHRVEFRMIGGNPVQRTYDKVCTRFKGTRHELHDVYRDRHGEYHDEYIYEILLN